MLTADNNIEPNASLPVTLTVNEAPSISGPRRVEFSTGQYDSFTPTITGYPAPTVEIVRGNLPPGLRLDTATGQISGEASIFWAGVTRRITLRAANGTGPAQTYRVRVKVVYNGCLGWGSFFGFTLDTCQRR